MSLRVGKGEFLALMGPSGSGKSTLLNLVLVADEPTGDRDGKGAREVLDLLLSLNQEFTKTIVMVTHDARAVKRDSTCRHLEKGVRDDLAPIPGARS